MSSSLCNKDLVVIHRKFLHPNNLSVFLDLTDIHGQLISPYAKRAEQWVKTSDSRTYMCKTKLLKT